MENLYTKGFKQFGYNFFGVFGQGIFTILLLILLTRSFSVSDFGLYNIILSAVLIITILGSLGIEPIIERYIPECLQRKNFLLGKKITKNALLIKLLTGFISIVLILLLSDIIFITLNIPILLEYKLILIFLVVVSLELKTLEMLMNALLEQSYKSIFRMSVSGLYLLLAFFSIMYGYGVLGVLLSFFITNLILVMVFLTRVKKRIFNKTGGEDEKIFKKIRKYGFHMYFSSLGDIILNISVDNFIISALLGTYFVGLYTFSNHTIQYIFAYSPILIAAPVLLPIIIRKFTETEEKKYLSNAFILYNKITAMFAIATAICVSLLSDKIIVFIFDPNYLPGIGVFFIFLVVFTLWSFAHPIRMAVISLEKTNIVLYSRIFVVYNLIADLILIPVIGIIGAALATGSSIIFIMLFQLFMIRKHVELKYPWRTIGNFIVNSIPMGIVLFISRDFITDIYSLFLVAVLGIVIYLGTCRLNRNFKGETVVQQQKTKFNLLKYF